MPRVINKVHIIPQFEYYFQAFYCFQNTFSVCITRSNSSSQQATTSYPSDYCRTHARTTLSLNVSKTKELIVDFRKRPQRPYTLMISGTPVERVSSFKYLGVNISEDLTWTAHIQTQVKKARQRLSSATAEEIQVLTSNPENFLFRGHRKCTDSVHLSVVWKRVKPGLQSSAESCALSWARLRVCSPLSAGHLPQTLQKQSC